jgi:hypothetical protein
MVGTGFRAWSHPTASTRRGKCVADKTGHRDEGWLLRRRLDRADFLRLIGAGATLPFVPMSLAARPSGAQTTPLPSTPADLVAGGEFPIGLWWPPPPEETNQQRYQEIADANFNLVIGGNGVTNENAIRDALDAAEAVGVASGKLLKFLLTDDPGPRDHPGLQDIIRGDTGGAGTEDAQPGIMQYMNEQDDPASAPDGTASDLSLSAVQERIRERVRVLAGRFPQAEYPALAGINLFDEPNRKMFGRLKFAKTEVRDQFADNRDLPYANVLPSYAARSMMGTRTYPEYLDLYLKAVRPPLLSFDHYPLLTQNRTTPDYFSNWAAIRNRAREYGIPPWIIIQGVDFAGDIISPPRRKPNKPELFWQVNVSLAYGAKGIQYFTYWTPKDTPLVRYGEALVAEDGTLTDTYDRAKDVNDYLRKVGNQLLPLTSEPVVMHTGVRRARPGVQPFKADGWLSAASGSPVILGKFRRSLDAPERYLLVVNRSLAAPSSTRLTVSNSVVEVLEFDPSTDPGTYSREPLGTSPRSFQVDLEAGRAALYRLSRTASG